MERILDEDGKYKWVGSSSNDLKVETKVIEKKPEIEEIIDELEDKTNKKPIKKKKK